LIRKVYRFSKSFARFPGGRLINEGPNSGEQFLRDVLLPYFKKGEPVTLDLIGAGGFSTGFLDGSFGEFAALHSAEEFFELFEIRADDDPGLEDEIRECMERAESETARR